MPVGMAIIRMDAHLGNDKDDLDTPYPFYGDASPQRHFMVSAAEARQTQGCVFMQIYDVDDWEHVVLINGKSLLGFWSDMSPPMIAKAGRWTVWMCPFGATPEDAGGYLKPGDNAIEVQRNPNGDNFAIGTMTLLWKYGE